MYILIEYCADGSFEPVSYLGAYETHEKAHEAMCERMLKVKLNYLEWRGLNYWDDAYVGTDDASYYLDGEGDVLQWYIFDMDKPHDINGYA